MPATETQPAKCLAPLPWAPGAPRRRLATSGVPWGPRITCSAGRVILVFCAARDGAQRWDVPLLENVLLALRTREGTFSRVAILEKRVTEKCVPGTRKAVETTGGDRWRSIGSRDPGRRREASWSRGAAECDRRPVFRKTSLGRSAPGSGSPSHRPAAGNRGAQVRLGPCPTPWPVAVAVPGPGAACCR
jgi:hypothetical protein